MHPKPYILSVLSGPNTGAAVALPSGLSTIGVSEEDTVVLDDELPHPVSLGLSGDRLRVLTENSGLTIRGQGEVATNVKVATNLPAVIRLSADTLVAVSRYGDVKKSKGWRWGVLAAVIACGAVWVEQSGQLPWVGPAKSAVASQWSTLTTQPKIEAETQTPVAQPTAPRVAVCDVACQTELASVFQTRLHDAGLGGLTVDPDAGVLRVTGAVADGQLDQWRQIRRDFEIEQGRGLGIVVNIRQNDAPPVIDIQSVWLGANPEVRLRNGSTLYTGDRTQAGWVVSEISPDGVSLSKGDATIVLSY